MLGQLTSMYEGFVPDRGARRGSILGLETQTATPCMQTIFCDTGGQERLSLVSRQLRCSARRGKHLEMGCRAQ